MYTYTYITNKFIWQITFWSEVLCLKCHSFLGLWIECRIHYQTINKHPKMSFYLMWSNLEASLVLLLQCFYQLFDYMICNMIHMAPTLEGKTTGAWTNPRFLNESCTVINSLYKIETYRENHIYPSICSWFVSETTDFNIWYSWFNIKILV